MMKLKVLLTAVSLLVSASYVSAANPSSVDYDTPIKFYLAIFRHHHLYLFSKIAKTVSPLRKK